MLSAPSTFESATSARTFRFVQHLVAGSALLGLVTFAIVPAAFAGSFTDVTASAGVGYSQHTPQTSPNCRHDILTPGGSVITDFCEPERMTGGAAVADVDGDGWLDLLVTRLDGSEKLFRNQGNGTFQDFTAAAGLSTTSKASNGALFFDAENDGDADLYLTTTGRAGATDAGAHLFYINDGSGVFTEVGAARGADLAASHARVGQSIAVGDYDLDGFSDLYVGEWRSGSLAPGNASLTRLLRNQGAAMPGHFQDTTVAAGVFLDSAQGSVWVFAPAFVDLDADAYPELALASDFGSSELFSNDGDGTFTNITASSNTGTDENGMGSTFGDYDGDGDLDWFVTSIFDPDSTCETETCNWGYTGNRLYRNDGGGVFSDATDAAGVRDGRWGWGTVFFDADNDGDLDLVMTNGVDFPGYTTEDALFTNDAMRFWENDGSGVFTEKATLVGLTDTGSGKGLLTFDYDQDGDLDLYVVNNATGGILYRNDETSGNGWLRVEASGVVSNADGWGAIIRVQAKKDGPIQVRHLGASSHFLGQSENVAHFGLGAPTGGLVHRVEVEWPKTGRIQSCRAVPPNQSIEFIEPTGPGDNGVEPCSIPVPATDWLGRSLLMLLLPLGAFALARVRCFLVSENG